MVQEQEVSDKNKRILSDLEEYFIYHEGNLYCIKSYGKTKLGLSLRNKNKSGHYAISIKNQSILLHRAIFLMYHKWLPEFLDHIDRNPANNLIDNLRPASKATNSWNRYLQSNSTSGIRGVSYNKNPKSTSKWGAYIKINGKRLWLGSYKTKELAEEAYLNEYSLRVSSGEVVP
jgi:hypothetical protein